MQQQTHNKIYCGATYSEISGERKVNITIFPLGLPESQTIEDVVT